MGNDHFEVRVPFFNLNDLDQIKRVPKAGGAWDVQHDDPAPPV